MCSCKLLASVPKLFGWRDLAGEFTMILTAEPVAETACGLVGPFPFLVCTRFGEEGGLPTEISFPVLPLCRDCKSAVAACHLPVEMYANRHYLFLLQKEGNQK